MVKANIPMDVKAISFRPALVHPLPWTRSDGVSFMALTNCDKNGGQERRLGYARFVSDGGKPGTAVMKTDTARGVLLVTLPGPAGDFSFDDAYWLEPVLKGKRK